MRLICFKVQSALEKTMEENYDGHAKLRFCDICVLFWIDCIFGEINHENHDGALLPSLVDVTEKSSRAQRCWSPSVYYPVTCTSSHLAFRAQSRDGLDAYGLRPRQPEVAGRWEVPRLPVNSCNSGCALIPWNLRFLSWKIEGHFVSTNETIHLGKQSAEDSDRFCSKLNKEGYHMSFLLFNLLHFRYSWETIIAEIKS